ncbi:hypothetical protein SAMN05192541_12393 [Bradyrhizobium arachidis]|nr:hypothetical protein SAMN05192541_12393 [Bradyrhizobium arachidis]
MTGYMGGTAEKGTRRRKWPDFKALFQGSALARVPGHPNFP